MHDNSIITDEIDIAEAFAEKYSRASSDENYDQSFIQYKHAREASDIIQHTGTERHPLNVPISINEMEDVLKNSKDSSPGPDNISYAFLKQLPDNAKQFLLKLYNKIYLSHQFPKAWAEAFIIPLLKPDKTKEHVSSYKPISLTCTLCKVLEKIINQRLKWYLEKHNLLTACQSAFRKHRSTHDNIIQLESEIHEAFANKQKLLAVFIDIEKAFDITWRHRIIKTIQDWNITGNITAFIQNFLSDRSYKVRVNGVLSNKKVLQNGIPQGSVLSTTLFLVAINDIITNFTNPVQASLYADDLVIYSKGKNVKTLESLIQQSLNNIETSGFKLSSDKTKCILFSRKNELTLPVLTPNNTHLKFTPNAKFL